MNTVEHTVLGGPDSFMTVRHLVVHGTNFEIGRALGSLAAERYGLNPASLAADPLYARVRRACFAEHYPIHLERVRGVAAALDLDANDDSFDLGILPYHLGPGPPAPACSVVYYPPSTTATGRGYLSRNYDFSTGTIAELMGLPLPPEVRSQMRPVMSEPYLMEWYPEDGGYASLAIQAFDVLSGVLDGINSEGLRRRGFSSSQIAAIKRAYRTIYRSGLPLEEAKAALRAEEEESPDAATCLRQLREFIETSPRGIIR